MNEIEMRMSEDFYEGMFVGEHKEELAAQVTRILTLVDETGDPPPHDVRIKIVNTLFDCYVEQTGYSLNGIQANLLANWLLFEELTDNHPDKVARTEYPIMTKRQLRTRHLREVTNEIGMELATEQTYLGRAKDSTATGRID